ncbi:prolyl 3-hydroxylase 1 [Lampetra fluviatilis]
MTRTDGARSSPLLLFTTTTTMMMMVVMVVMVVVTVSTVEVSSTLQPYDLLFDSGVEAYHRGDWRVVVSTMEQALRNHAERRRLTVVCGQRCTNHSAFHAVQAEGDRGEWGMWDLRLLEAVVRRAHCLHSCLEQVLGPASLHLVSEETQLEFRKRSPYNYLQLAYFKMDNLAAAAAAAHTFSVGNPEHTEMRQNLEYYRQVYNVEAQHFVDREARPHLDAFQQGVERYAAEEFPIAVEYMELAVDEYFAADSECRAQCEGPFEFDGYAYLDYNSDLYQAMADHYVQVLNCRHDCARELSTRPGRTTPIEDFLPAHYNYLQFAYYKMEELESAIACTRSYLLFRPDDEIMQQNERFYVATLGEAESAGIEPRKEVASYVQRSLLEKEMLFFASEAFATTFLDPDTWTPDSVKPQSLLQRQRTERSATSRISEEIGSLMREIEEMVEEKTREHTQLESLIKEGGPLLYPGVVLTMDSRALNGSQRALLDDVITAEESKELLELVNTAGASGDGYRGKPSPHTPNEKFDGITVYKALRFGQEGRIALKTARLFYDVSERVRSILESYFRLESPLYFSYTHLVCRTAIAGQQDNRSDLSHPIHADNCVLDPESKNCLKEPPAYFYRDYSAILYLNGGFEGGNFVFTELDADTVTAEVVPQAGRMVAFSSGGENPHGVRAVTKGQRCAMALWFTLNPIFREKERIKADDLIKMLFTEQQSESDLFPNSRDEL